MTRGDTFYVLARMARGCAYGGITGGMVISRHQGEGSHVTPLESDDEYSRDQADSEAILLCQLYRQGSDPADESAD